MSDNSTFKRHDNRELNFIRESQSNPTPAPVDDEGIPMLSNHEVGAAFGWNKHNSKRVSHSRLIRQYKAYPDETKTDKAANTGQNARTWFSLADVVHHLNTLSATDPSYTATANFHSKRLDSARKSEAARIKKGGPVYNLRNQPHPKNKDIHKRMDVGTREWTSERIGMTKGPLAPSTEGITFSNLDNPKKHGKMVPVEGESS
jgi:hypothetical protein